MKKYYYLLLFFSLVIITLSSCSNNTEPATQDKFEIISDPLSIEIDVSSDSLQIENSPNHSIDYSELKLNGVDLTSVKYYCPTQRLEVNREFVVAKNDSFSVVINNCKPEYEWTIDLGENNNWLNSEVALLRTEKIINLDSTIDYKFIFKTLKEGKGYICLIEKNQLGEISSNESHGLLIGYSTNSLNKISLNIDEITWKYNTKEGTFSTVSVNIKGTTNIYRLRGMSSGDGELMANEIAIQNDDSFEIELPVAFSHIEGVTLKTDSELLLYGTVGLPKIIQLINPKNDGQ
jgi:hypothetical protein